MSGPKKDSDGDYDDSSKGEDRQGRKDGGTPDYEEGQSSPISDKDFDNSKSSW